MAEEKEKIKESSAIEYSPEELETIDSLLTFFNKAPGQIDIPQDDIEEEPQDSDIEIGAPISDTDENDGPPKSTQYDELPEITDIEENDQVSEEYKDYSNLENIPIEADPPPEETGPVNETLAQENLSLPDDEISLDFGEEEIASEDVQESTPPRDVDENEIPDFNDLNLDTKTQDFNEIPEDNETSDIIIDTEPEQDETPEESSDAIENISIEEPIELSDPIDTPSESDPLSDALNTEFDSGDSGNISTDSMGDLGDLGGLNDISEALTNEEALSNDIPSESTDPATDDMPDADADLSMDMPDADADLSMDAPDASADLSMDMPDADADLSMDMPDADADLSMDAPDASADLSMDMPDTDADLSMDVPDASADLSMDMPDAGADLSMDVPDASADLSMDVPDASADLSMDMPDASADLSMDVPDASADLSMDVPDDLSMDVPDAGADLSMDVPDADLAPMDTGESFSDSLSSELKPPSLNELSPQTALEEAANSKDPYLEETQETESFSVPTEEFSMPETLVDPSPKEKTSSGEISDQELKALREKLIEYPKELRKRIIGAIVEDKISEAEARDLVLEIIAGEPHKKIEEELNKKVGDYSPKLEDDNREPRTVVTRPAYTEAGRRRQAKLIHYTRIGALAAIAFIILTTGIYYTALKPYLYHSIVDEGKELIILHGCRGKEQKEAEKLFQKSLEYYPEKIDAYLQYGDTYKRKGCYQLAFEKFYGKLELPSSDKVSRWNDMEVSTGKEIWKNTKSTPVLRWQDPTKKTVLIDNVLFVLTNHGAYTLTHLKKKKDHAKVLLALGNFHTNPANRFRQSDYKNNLLGIDYYQRILSFQPETPLFSKEEYISKAVRGIGDVYYHKKDYYKSLEHYEKIIKNDPYDIDGQSGVLNNLIKIYHKTNDPRLVLQQHSLIKHRLKIEKKLPIYILAKLSSFYIDLPISNDLRIKYNVSPVDPVNGVHLRERAIGLLNILFSKKEKDIYGNEKLGKQSAEGYYQRGRYYRYVMKKPRMALKQMEYAYRYDPAHFLALNERAELLMELYDYQGAIDHLKLAMKYISDEAISYLGDRPEDETLIESDRASIPFNLGKALYLSLVKDLTSSNSWFRLKELEKFQTKTHSGIQGLTGVLEKTDEYFDRAENMGLHDPEKMVELYFYRGWSHYVRSDFNAALSNWERIDPKWNIYYHNIALARAHALYHLSLDNENMRKDYLENALGELLYLQEKYSREANMVKSPVPGNKSHIALFTRLAMIENNMGAIYELLNNEKKSLEHYWKSIDYSKQISKENEIAHLNIQLNFKRNGLEGKERYPVIMDYINPSIHEKSF